MTLEQEILFNQFGQGVYEGNKLISQFESLAKDDKKNLLREVTNLIMQSKSTVDDINEAISKSGLKPTFTPCIVIKKGLNHGNFEKIINFPESELTKSFRLLIYLFREGYYRRFLEEQGSPHKWWYWDLSDRKNLERIKKSNFSNL